MIKIVVVIALLVTIGAGIFYFLKIHNGISNIYQNQNVENQPAQPSPQPTDQSSQGNAGTSNTAPAINTPQDLSSTENNLNTADVDGLNTQLNQNDADAQNFSPRIRLKNGTSLNWAGYAIETNISNPQNDAVSDVKGSWVVPSLSCGNTNTYAASWVGIDGDSDGSVEQTGTEQECIGGQTNYYAWYEMYPKPGYKIQLPVKASDIMSAEVKYVGNNKYLLTLNDITSGWVFTTSRKSKALRRSAEWIVEAPYSGGILPLANFGTLAFSGASATLNGTTGSINNSSWQYDPINMEDSSGNDKATVSGLSSAGDSFSVTWKSSN